MLKIKRGSSSRQHEHLLQLYSTDDFLVRVVAAYLAPGLRRGGTTLMVATFEHFSATLGLLRTTGIDIKRLRQHRRLIWVDARLLSQQIEDDDSANDVLFDLAIGTLVKRLANSCGAQPLVIFGELVDLLWAEGKAGEALKLEERWSRLSSGVDFDLMCAYRVTGARDERRALQPICCAHSQVLVTETSATAPAWHPSPGSAREPRARPLLVSALEKQQRLAHVLRSQVAQTILGVLLIAQAMKARAPHELRADIDALAAPLNYLIECSLGIADELAGEHLVHSSLVEAVSKTADCIAHEFALDCAVTTARRFLAPEGVHGKLLHAIIMDVMKRAASDRGATSISVRFRCRGKYQVVEVHHDGDRIVLLGNRDIAFEHLLQNAQAFGDRFRLGSKNKDGPQLVCRWIRSMRDI